LEGTLEINWSLLTNFFIGLLAIVNPIGKIPIWMQAREGVGRVTNRWLAAMVVLVGGVVLLLFLIAGNYILMAFGIDVPSFRIGGGVVIMVVGIQMLRGNAINLDNSDDDDGQDPVHAARTRFKKVVIPMAVPLIAGPGSITTALLYGLRADSLVDHLAMTAILVGIMVIVYFILTSGAHLGKWVGRLPFIVITRIFGLIVVAVAAQLMVVGLGEAFPAWLDGGDSPIEQEVRQSENVEDP
jgi:multiple antibiotic resistance protein